jgi:hypothetical protein
VIRGLTNGSHIASVFQPSSGSRETATEKNAYQAALRVGGLLAFAAYHFPECAPPSTCSTSPVT